MTTVWFSWAVVQSGGGASKHRRLAQCEGARPRGSRVEPGLNGSGLNRFADRAGASPHRRLLIRGFLFFSGVVWRGGGRRSASRPLLSGSVRRVTSVTPVFSGCGRFLVYEGDRGKHCTVVI